jgi:hypothetical protein
VKPVVTHIGLGDIILQLGLFVGLSEREGGIGIPCYPQYYESVKSFFVNHPLIKVYTVPHINGADWGSPREQTYQTAIRVAGMGNNVPQIRLGIYKGIGIGTDFSKSFYEHGNVPYSARWDKCPIQNAIKNVPQLSYWYPRRKIFVHEDNARGFILTKLVDRGSCYAPSASDVNKSILQYVSLILEADEIHVIDSCFFHFINCFNNITAKLYLHRYPRWPRSREFMYETRLPWNLVD